MTASKDGISYEHDVTPTSGTPSKVIDPSSYATLAGRVLINSLPVYNGEIARVYIKDDPLVQPVTPDGDIFVLKGVSIPENNIIRIAVDLKNGERLSETFSLPNHKNRIYSLGECIFTYSPSSIIHPTKPQNHAQSVKGHRDQAERKIEINNPTFNGPTQIGDYNTQINGPKPREVSGDLIKEIIKHAPDKNTPIHIYRRSQEGESYDYATKIVLALIAQGYKNSFVDGITYDQIIGGDPVEAARQQKTLAFKLEPWAGGHQLNVTIPAN